MNRALCFALLLLVAGLAASQTLEDSRGVWRIGVAEFTGDSLLRENGYLLSSLPLLLRDRIEVVERHSVRDEEVIRRAEEIRTNAILDQRREISRLYTAYDRLYLADGPNASGRDPQFQRIEEARRTLETLQQYPPEEIVVARELETEYVDGTDGRLIPAVSANPRSRAEEFDLDLLIYGSVEQIADYLFLEIAVYERAGEVGFAYSSAGSREFASDRVSELSVPLISRIYGDEWGSLEISVSVEESRVWLDSVYLGTGNVTEDVASVGEHRIVVETPGFVASEYIVSVEPGEKTVFVAEPGTQVADELELSTEPPGALAYLGSVWLGTTPLTSIKSLEPAQIKITLPGYWIHQLPVHPTEEVRKIVNLIPDVGSYSDLVSTRRSIFYRSLGFFAISVPVPMLMLDRTNQLTSVINAAGSTDLDLLQDLIQERNKAFAGYVGGMFLAGSLLVNLVVDLLEYVDVVGLTTG